MIDLDHRFAMKWFLDALGWGFLAIIAVASWLGHSTAGRAAIACWAITEVLLRISNGLGRLIGLSSTSPLGVNGTAAEWLKYLNTVCLIAVLLMLVTGQIGMRGRAPEAPTNGV